MLIVLVTIATAWMVGASHRRFQIPQLKVRTPELYAHEFAKQQTAYNNAAAGINAHPEDLSNYRTLARVLMSEAKATGDHPYYYPAAMRVIEEGLKRRSDDFELSVLKCSVLLSLHHFAEARSLVYSIGDSYGYSPALYGMLCDACVELGDYSAAVRAVDNMMQLRPGLDAYARAAYLREIHGDVTGALQALRLAVDAGLPGSEDKAWTQCTLASTLFRYGYSAEAEAQYAQVLNERHLYPTALAGLARVLEKRSRLDSAESLTDKALRLQPEISFVEQRIALAQSKQNKVAADSLKSLMIAMFDEDEQAGHVNFAERAICYCTYGIHPDQALRYAQKELSLRPENITAQYAMALALHAHGRNAEALSYLQQATRTGYADPDVVRLKTLCEQM